MEGFPLSVLQHLEPFLSDETLSSLARVCRGHLALCYLRAASVFRWNRPKLFGFRFCNTQHFSRDAFLNIQLTKIYWMTPVPKEDLQSWYEIVSTLFKIPPDNVQDELIACPFSCRFYMDNIAFESARNIAKTSRPFAGAMQDVVALNTLTCSNLAVKWHAIHNSNYKLYCASQQNRTDRFSFELAFDALSEANEDSKRIFIAEARNADEDDVHEILFAYETTMNTACAMTMPEFLEIHGHSVKDVLVHLVECVSVPLSYAAECVALMKLSNDEVVDIFTREDLSNILSADAFEDDDDFVNYVVAETYGLTKKCERMLNFEPTESATHDAILRLFHALTCRPTFDDYFNENVALFELNDIGYDLLEELQHDIKSSFLYEKRLQVPRPYELRCFLKIYELRDATLDRLYQLLDERPEQVPVFLEFREQLLQRVSAIQEEYPDTGLLKTAERVAKKIKLD
jgi:hypothetical protein